MGFFLPKLSLDIFVKLLSVNNLNLCFKRNNYGFGWYLVDIWLISGWYFPNRYGSFALLNSPLKHKLCNVHRPLISWLSDYWRNYTWHEQNKLINIASMSSFYSTYLWAQCRKKYHEKVKFVVCSLPPTILDESLK